MLSLFGKMLSFYSTSFLGIIDLGDFETKGEHRHNIKIRYRNNAQIYKI